MNGYYFNQDIGTLTQHELEEIASHPPSIDLRRYKYYRSLDLDDLMEEFPALVDIIGHNITYEDLFYYATRGWIPNYDSINYKIDRWNRYEELSNVGKSLIDMIYHDREGYVNSMPHHLERSILDYDTYMDDENAVRAIAEREGIILPETEDLRVSFYDILADKIVEELPYRNYAM